LSRNIVGGSEAQAFDYGAVDFISKPIAASTVKARIKTHLSLLLARQTLETQNLLLEQKVRARTHEIELTQDAAIYSLSMLAEARDEETGEHIQRTHAENHNRDVSPKRVLFDFLTGLIAVHFRHHNIQ
jgi:response regulator RpfG family c-di-GMP phosphodiesterase